MSQTPEEHEEHPEATLPLPETTPVLKDWRFVNDAERRVLPGTPGAHLKGTVVRHGIHPPGTENFRTGQVIRILVVTQNTTYELEGQPDPTYLTPRTATPPDEEDANVLAGLLELPNEGPPTDTYPQPLPAGTPAESP